MDYTYPATNRLMKVLPGQCLTDPYSRPIMQSAIPYQGASSSCKRLKAIRLVPNIMHAYTHIYHDHHTNVPAHEMYMEARWPGAFACF